MSASKDTAGKESGEDGGKKGRFTVKFATGRPDSEDAEMAATTDIQELPSQNDDVNHASQDNVRVDLMGRKSLYLYEENMKKMPRVVTFLQLVSQSGSHTTYPNEQEEKAAKTTAA